MIPFVRLVILFFLLMGTLPATSYAQIADRIPPFGMTLSNGRYFGPADLPNDKPVVLIYFAPDCDHCHTLLNTFFQRVNDFRSATVVLVTFKPMAEVTTFERAYQTHKYPHVKVGTEGASQSLRQFYKLQSTPFTALYTKEGKLIVSYRKETPVDALLQQIKKL